MFCEKFALILNVWMLSPAGATAALGDVSFKSRDMAFAMTRFIGACEALPPVHSERHGGLPQQWWAIHVDFWACFAAAEEGSESHLNYVLSGRRIMKGPARPWIHDPEIHRRAYLLRRTSNLYGKGCLPGG